MLGVFVTLRDVWCVGAWRDLFLGVVNALTTRIVHAGMIEISVSVLMESVKPKRGSVMMILTVEVWRNVLARSAAVKEEPASGSVTQLRTAEEMMPSTVNI